MELKNPCYGVAFRICKRVCVCVLVCSVCECVLVCMYMHVCMGSKVMRELTIPSRSPSSLDAQAHCTCENESVQEGAEGWKERR